MSVGTTTGVALVARMLRRLGEGTAPTVAGFAEEEGFARSTVFEVARRLEAAGLVRRDGQSGLVPGAAMVQLCLAEYGLAPLHGPAEALLSQLRDETQAVARLVGDDGTVLLVFATRRPIAEGVVLEAAVTARARLTLSLRASATRAERDMAQARLTRCAASLLYYLDTGVADD